VPAAAIALISRLFLMGSHDAGFENRPRKLSSVYLDGNGAVRHEPFTENASTKIIAMGNVRKIVENSAVISTTAFASGRVTRCCFLAPPLDCVRYTARRSY